MALATNPFPGSLFETFDRLQRGIRPLVDIYALPGVGAIRRGFFPTVNVGSTADAVNVQVLLPGVEQKDVELTIQQNVLTIAGKRQATTDAAGQAQLRERFHGEFRRTVTLPADVDADQVQAKMRDGVLYVQIARRREAAQRRIPVS